MKIGEYLKEYLKDFKDIPGYAGIYKINKDGLSRKQIGNIKGSF